MIFYSQISSPLGKILLSSDGQALTGLYLADQKYFPQPTQDWIEYLQALPFAQVSQQLQEYFQQQRQIFDLPLNPMGTAFQIQVWQQLRSIPYGTTRTYGQLATQLGQPNASRAVGAANGRNPISIIIPCHRVIASSGNLTGYAGGVDRKRWLIDHESASEQKNPAKKEQIIQPSLF